MGTGIYRHDLSIFDTLSSVPCGYRDIPQFKTDESEMSLRSLWVQGYTGQCRIGLQMEIAFPVGTGIYRKIKR